MAGLFQRINFFKGLFMKTEDWRKEQQYHMEKQRFHNKYLHTPGVVFECLEGLRVSVSEEGNSFIVAPGYAIDGEGRDIYVPETKEILIPNLQSFNPPTTIYISISYSESLVDHRDNSANPMYSGHACVTEDTRIEITAEKPDNHLRIELGRIRLSENPDHIRNPDFPARPGKAVVPAVPGRGWISRKAVVPVRTKTDLPAVKTVDPTEPQILDELILTQVPEAGAMARTRGTSLSISDLGEKIIDTKVVVIAKDKKPAETRILIEQYPKESTPPMYLVFFQSLDGVRNRWSIACTENDEGTLDYTLHIRNESMKNTTAMCRVYRVRI